MSQIAYTKGQRVQFVVNSGGRLGLTVPGGSRFVDATVGDGDYGTYLAEALHELELDWHMIEVEVGGETYWCPVHSGYFEVVSS